MPRVDGGSVFGRLLDWERGGFCQIVPATTRFAGTRRYLDGSLVLETMFRAAGGEIRVLDFFAMYPGGARNPYRQLLRFVEGIQGRLDVRVTVAPRFDYGEVRPWIRRHGMEQFSATGGNDALVINSDFDLTERDHTLVGKASVRPGERLRLSIRYWRPEEIDPRPRHAPSPEEIDARLDETLSVWRGWSSKGRLDGLDGPAAIRSALVLKGLTCAPTGAIVAAATTSLPEVLGGSRNWDYRYSWIRDSWLTARSLAELGYEHEANGFRRFVERSAAGNAHDLQVVYGVGGDRRLIEHRLDLDGYRSSRPVRVGNSAHTQLQLDAYGALLELAWAWHRRGHSPDDDYWAFLVDLANVAAARWREKDRGIWESRGTPRHFVHSKVFCWAALDRGIRLARDSARRAPTRRWVKARDEIREAIETEGYDKRRGVFTQTFRTRQMDAALLLLPEVDFVAYEDERMLRTVDAIRDELERDGLLRRYRSKDGLDGEEGVFLACSFWLAECLARQGRVAEAREVFDRATGTGNDLGLFSEQYDTKTGEMLGNFPQGLTHLSHIGAAVALAEWADG